MTTSTIWNALYASDYKKALSSIEECVKKAEGLSTASLRSFAAILKNLFMTTTEIVSTLAKLLWYDWLQFQNFQLSRAYVFHVMTAGYAARDVNNETLSDRAFSFLE